MRYLTFIIIIFFTQVLTAQSRLNKLSINLFANFYSYGEGQGHLNNVVRVGEGFGFTYKTYDTIKRSGMIYELNTNNTTAYYKNILSGGSVLEVNDLHANLNFIFPILILHQKRIEHSFGFGIGVGTLLGRDYFDENNDVLAYNSILLKEVQFGHYWTSAFMLDYELNLKLYKKIGINLGLRYTTATPIHGGNLNFRVSQGNSFGFKYGFFYEF